MTSKIIVIGVNHDSAPVDVRERVAFAPEVVPEAISDLISSTQLEEGVILSTCNRTEIYGWFAQEDQAALRVMTLFSGWQSSMDCPPRISLLVRIKIMAYQR